MNEYDIATIPAKIGDYYSELKWRKAYPTGISTSVLATALTGLTMDHVKHALKLLPEKHPTWPPEIGEFVKLCRFHQAREQGSRGCGVNNCPVVVTAGQKRCEFHPFGTSEKNCFLITKALINFKELLDYYQFLDGVAPREIGKRFNMASLHDPKAVTKHGEPIWPEWTPEFLDTWDSLTPEATESPSQYKDRINRQLRSFIDQEVYGVAAA